MIKWTAATSLAASALMASGTAQAREVAGWEIGEYDSGCLMQMEYEGKGETTVTFMYDADGTYLFAIGNSGWTPTDKKKYEASIDVDDRVWGPTDAVATKMTGKPTLVLGIAADSDLEPALRNGSSLGFYLGEDRIDQLSLSGTGAAGAATRTCSERVGRRIAAARRVEEEAQAAADREQARFAHLPDNPFAGEPPSFPSGAIPSSGPRGPNQPAKVRTIGFSDTDYPSMAVRNGETGVAVARVTVGTNGRASDCTVTKSSGSATLDAATCSLISTRSRFDVATDARGNPVASPLTLPITWRLPRPEPTTPAETSGATRG